MYPALLLYVRMPSEIYIGKKEMYIYTGVGQNNWDSADLTSVFQ